MKTYLGDGVYAEIENGMIKLTTERDGRIETIYLEWSVYESLAAYFKANRNTLVTFVD